MPNRRVRSLRRYPPLPDAGSQLAELLKLQRTRIGISIKELSTDTGLSIAAINQALGGVRITPLVAALLCRPLKIDPVHAIVACCRDELERLAPRQRDSAANDGAARRGRGRPGRTGAVGPQHQRLRGVISDVNAFLRWTRTSTYAAAGSGRRLAFTAHRSDASRPATREDVAAQMLRLIDRPRRSDPSTVHRQLAFELLCFEQSLLPLDDARLQLWLSALSTATQRPIKLGDLDARAAELMRVHRVSSTSDPRELHDGPNLRVVVPDKAKLELRRTQSVFGAANVEQLTYTGPSTRSAWIIDARHPGIELATVIRGRVRLLITDKRVTHGTDRTEQARAKIEELRDPGGRDIYAAGETVIFPSGYWHHAEFLADKTTGAGEASVLSVNITGNLFLHRRYRGPLAPP